ncbi:uncharacterized protein LOC132748639 [Ruditapes philippinarum]|uniref:uncharacterized protein LOC132748639 n=1 Tax=Ruditapes philippinarum TaxID=129788 RepID=UPI00295C1218|nr:uncharacterized protein LOC132748639 [Ruditapes philippinarum]
MMIRRHYRDREEEFMSRYHRVIGANEDHSVFKTNLPGSQPQTRQPDVGITAGNQPKLISGTNDIGEDTTITETSTFSEITLTDDSDEEELQGRKIGTGLRKAEFHAGSSTLTEFTYKSLIGYFICRLYFT